MNSVNEFSNANQWITVLIEATIEDNSFVQRTIGEGSVNLSYVQKLNNLHQATSWRDQQSYKWSKIEKVCSLSFCVEEALTSSWSISSPSQFTYLVPPPFFAIMLWSTAVVLIVPRPVVLPVLATAPCKNSSLMEEELELQPQWTTTGISSLCL